MSAKYQRPPLLWNNKDKGLLLIQGWYTAIETAIKSGPVPLKIMQANGSLLKSSPRLKEDHCKASILKKLTGVMLP